MVDEEHCHAHTATNRYIYTIYTEIFFSEMFSWVKKFCVLKFHWAQFVIQATHKNLTPKNKTHEILHATNNWIHKIAYTKHKLFFLSL